MANPINGQRKPAQVAVIIESREGLIGQYIRHADTDEIFKITEVGRQGVTAYRADGFGGPVSKASQEYLITWASLKYKHRIMTHVADVKTRPDQLQ